MSLITIFSLIACLFVLVLSGLVLGKDPSKRLYQVFGLFGIASAVWTLGFAILFSVSNASEAMTWIRFYEAGLVFIPSTYFHFIVTYVSENKIIKITWQKQIVLTGYILSAAFLVLVWTPLFANGVERYPWGFYPSVGLASRAFNVMFAIYIILGFIELFKYFKSSSGFQRNQTKYLLLATVIGFGLSLTNFLPLYGMRGVYPLGHFGALFAVVLLSYAIVKHNLLDIDIVVRRSVVYSSLTAILAAAYVSTVFLLGEVFKGVTSSGNIFPTIIFAVIVAMTFEPLHRNVQVVVDRLFFRKTYEHLSIANSAREELRQMVNPTTISSYVLNAIDDVLKITHGWLLVYNKQLEVFQVAAEINPLSEKTFDMVLDQNANLIEFINSQEKPLVLETQSNPSFRRDADRQDREALAKMRVALVAPLRGRGGTVGLLLLGPKKSDVGFCDGDINLISTLCDHAAISIENASLYDDLQASYLNTVKSLVAALEAKDEYTKGHSERVAGYARAIAIELKMSDKESQLLYEVSLLHDVGKIGISEQVLNKKGKLTKNEHVHIQSHTITGERILSTVGSIKDGLSAVRHHHEKLNGCGYPDGLSESNIPLPARILAVADAYDAMTTSRPYRNAMTTIEAIEELKTHASSQFDPNVVRAFISVILKTKHRRRIYNPKSATVSRRKGHLRSA